MKRKGLICLVMINALLLGALVMTKVSPTAQAQRGAVRAGDYTMVAGKVRGREGSTLYIADQANQVLLSVAFQPGGRGTGKLIPMAVRDIAPDFQVREGR